MSHPNPAAALGKILENHAAGHSDNISVAMPCRVLTFDEETLMASVQPLIKLTASEPATILSVPVTGQKYKFELDTGLGNHEFETIMRPVLERGDVVYVVFADAEIKNTLTGQVAAPDTDRRHSRNDAVIVGVMPCSL